ncbi:MAG: nitroreductase [Eubacteriales bacterium]|jgi:nitroreductase|nr:nitroreductase [Eubacteriales bacterium]
MNETLNNLKTRRSIRSFLPKQVDKAILEQVLEAGTYAPTGGGQQVPVIVAVQDEATVKQLSRMNAAVNGNKSDPFYGAPTVLVVLAERSRGTFLLDGAAVITTLLNAAHASGLGSCWIHRAKEMFESDEGMALLRQWGIEGDFEGIGQVVLGYPAAPAPEPAARKENYIVRV